LYNEKKTYRLNPLSSGFFESAILTALTLIGSIRLVAEVHPKTKNDL